ncbi:Frizzled-4 [Aphelenchoides fujianensis]|nr:Frizzled-4 [Aphelenchoides fujianensis]
MKIRLLFAAVLPLLLARVQAAVPSSRAVQCTAIQEPMCATIGYNHTRYPNFAGSDSERAAIDEFRTFESLISYGCSEELRFFLCSSYFPLCTDKVPVPVGPCRPLCSRVRAACVSVLKEFGFPWPASLECEKFPKENEEGSMCMEGPNGQRGGSGGAPAAIPTFTQREAAIGSEYPAERRPSGVVYHTENLVVQPDKNGGTPTCLSKQHVYVNRTAMCVPKCPQEDAHNPTDVHATRSALIIGSILSFILTAVCLLSSCVGKGVLRAGRPLNNTLFYSAFCFAFSAVVYMISIFQRDRIACFTYQSHELFVVPGIPHVPCTLVAALLYYSGTAARLWWLCTCVAWRWSMRGDERNPQKVSRFLYHVHVFAWATPFVLLTIALMAQAAHAEPLSGVCLIGAVGRSNFLMFVVLRDVVVVVASALILGSGCLASATLPAAAPAASTAVGRPAGLHGAQSDGFMSSSGIGILCAILPAAQSFWLIAALQHMYGGDAFEPVLGVGSMSRLLADPSLGALLGGAFFVYILHSCWGDGRPPAGGYQAARHPLYPTPVAGGFQLPPKHPAVLNAAQANLAAAAQHQMASSTSVPATSNSQRSSANITTSNVYPTASGALLPTRGPPPPPPLAALRNGA